jgi:hypothetical protein
MVFQIANLLCGARIFEGDSGVSACPLAVVPQLPLKQGKNLLTGAEFLRALH